MSDTPTHSVDGQNPADQVVCPNCGVRFVCGLNGTCPAAGCWCAGMPQVMPRPVVGARCLCPECLKAIVAAKVVGRRGRRR